MGECQEEHDWEADHISYGRQMSEVAVVWVGGIFLEDRCMGQLSGLR